MATNVLNQDWSDYDDKKRRGFSDTKDFACTEQWEINYLLSKIKRLYPLYPDQHILTAIATCCQTLKSPHPRKPFVECVMKRLREQ